MAVLIEGCNVIVRCDRAIKLYPGGVQGLEKDCPNKTFCTDGFLARIAFMTYDDARRFIAKLAGYGLTYCLNGECVDLALVTAEDGADVSCHWLCMEQHSKGYFFCWMAGEKQGDVAAPSNRDLDNYEPILHSVSIEDFEKHFEFVGQSDGGVREYLDRRTGQKMYCGRTTSFEVMIIENRVDILWNRIFELQDIIDQARQSKGMEAGKEIYAELRAITEEAELMATEIVPISIYLCGLVHRVQKHWEDAEKWFHRFANNRPYNPEVWREINLCLGMLGRKDEALTAAKRAYELAPHSPGALGNLALSYMKLGQLIKAERFIHHAISLDPKDTKNQDIQKIIAKQLGK